MLAPWRTVAVLPLVLFGCVGRVDSVDADGIQASLTLSSETLPADGTTSARLKMRVLYSNGLGVQGAQIKLVADAPDLVLTQPGPTDANGMAEGGVRCTQVGDSTLRMAAALDGIPVAALASAQLHCVAATEAADVQLAFLGTPAPTRADANSRMVVVVRALHRMTQAPAAAQAIWITSDVAQDTIEPPSGITDDQGRLVVGVAAERAGVHHLIAHSGDATAQQSVVFVAGPPSAQTSILTALPAAVVADGNASIAVTAQVRDAYANPVPQAGVSFICDAGNVTFAPPMGVTDVNGVFATAAASTVAQQSAFVAALSADGVTVQISTPAGFTLGISDAAQSTIAANPNWAQVDDIRGIMVTVVARDLGGRLLPGSSVSIDAQQGAFVFNPNAGYSDASGRFVTHVTSTVPISDTVVATIVP
jgi:adhesin/invasin